MPTSFRSPVPFVGVGPGRCGSHTLVEIISACRRVHVGHETVQVPWYEGSSDPELGKLIRRLRSDREDGVLGGEVGPSMLRQIPDLRSAFRGLKVICLHRDRDSVVRSFMQFGDAMPPISPKDRHKWADGCLGPDRMDAGIVKCFPVIDGADREQCLGFYWQMYETLMSRVKPPVLHIQTDSLSHRDTAVEIFKFLEIPVDDRVFAEVKRSWSTRQVQEIQRQMRRKHLYG